MKNLAMRSHRVSKRLKRKMKKRIGTSRDLWLAFALVFAFAVGAMAIWTSLVGRANVQTATPGGSLQAQSAVPPYFPNADAAKPYPNLIPASYYRQYPLVERAYKIAGQIPGVLAQQPGYCYCDRVGHRSLLDCYASDHAAG
jgi:hypothetical protein